MRLLRRGSLAACYACSKRHWSSGSQQRLGRCIADRAHAFRRGLSETVSERIQKIDQVVPLLIIEADTETLIIKVHHVEQSGCRSVVEVGRPRGQPP